MVSAVETFSGRKPSAYHRLEHILICPEHSWHPICPIGQPTRTGINSRSSRPVFGSGIRRYATVAAWIIRVRGVAQTRRQAAISWSRDEATDAVCVDHEDVACPIDLRLLLGCEWLKEPRDVLPDALWEVPGEEGRCGPQALVEVVRPLDRGGGVRRVVDWNLIAAVVLERYAKRRIDALANVVSRRVRQQDVLSANVELLAGWDAGNCAVVEVALWERVTPTKHPGLIYCYPVLDLSGPSCEYYTGVFREVANDLLVQPPTVGELEAQRKIPVV